MAFMVSGALMPVLNGHASLKKRYFLAPASLQKAEEHTGSFVVLWLRCQFSYCLVLKSLPHFLSHFELSLISQGFTDETNQYQLYARNNNLAEIKDVMAFAFCAQT